MNALTVSDLTVAYGPVRALDGVSFEVASGCVTAVLGANGAGKTTLLRTLSGLVRPSAGVAHLSDRDLLRTPAEEMTRTGLAHVPEGRGVIAELTVRENLRLGVLGARRTGRRRAFDVDRIYDLFPVLGERRDQVAHTLSGGERQMLVIGRALLAEPRILLLDEPSLGLAPRIVAQIFALLRNLVDTEGLTVLLAEQNARSALSIADRGLVLGLGRVVADEPAHVLADDVRVRDAYLGN
ncbi:ABC transporter ATP-binding protein [Nocardioides sp. GY 10113]|uniref:ABC transporter ATP-binding protein n=1 Tax=Nocardioides sp. GY 10113 TaxID=2569761 RepID=UPI0010A7AD86|nr:ABC transporter ATP-binding protein [Nocardioides sp. GY 10113]TIC80644.1 ABC transporter ATP-binding protein [Nocardioides sp. GY 10113]